MVAMTSVCGLPITPSVWATTGSVIPPHSSSNVAEGHGSVSEIKLHIRGFNLSIGGAL